EGGGLLPTANIKTGEKVAIKYLANSPQESCAGDGRAKLENEIVGIVLGALIMPAWIVFVQLSWALWLLRRTISLCDARGLNRRWALLPACWWPLGELVLSRMKPTSPVLQAP